MVPSSDGGFEMLFFRDRTEWERWLLENHASSKGIWMLYHRKGSDVQGIGYHEALDEAIRFGWIDSLIKKLDETRYIRKFTPRKTDSKWSKKNLLTAQRLISCGRMTEAGLKVLGNLDLRLRSVVEANGPTQEQMDSLFQDDLEIRSLFDGLPGSHRNRFASWIFDAKSEGTRVRRTEKAARMIREKRPPLI